MPIGALELGIVLVVVLIFFGPGAAASASGSAVAADCTTIPEETAGPFPKDICEQGLRHSRLRAERQQPAQQVSLDRDMVFSDD